MLGVGSQKEGLLRAIGEISEYTDSPTDGFVAIADRAESNGVGWTVRYAFHLRTVIDEPCGQQNEICLHLNMGPGGDENPAFFAQRRNPTAHQKDSIFFGLGPQSR